MVVTQTKLQNGWLKAFIACLFCYALFGRSFAYLFLGEFLLVLGFMIFLLSQRVMLAFSDITLTLWSIFAFWGFLRTLPYVGAYGVDALRDAVLWGYGVFAVIIAAFVTNSMTIARGLNTYRKFLRFYLPVLPIMLFVSLTMHDSVPKIPWTKDVPSFALRSGEAAVHLAAAGLFLSIFSEQKKLGMDKIRISLGGILAFIGISLAAVSILINSRGGFLSMTVPVVLASTLKIKKFGWKLAIFALVAGVLAVGVLETDVIQIKVRNRTYTADQVGENLSSIVGLGHSKTDTENTKTWRLIWWSRIVHYTFFGPYFWQGKGFGKNLIVEDGPPGVTKEDLATRSPHNGSMTVLARMGVPGLVVWVLLNALFGGRLFRAYRRATRLGKQFWARIDLWLFCYWLAALINMSFDVYLEGPQGGIWFWSLIGFGVAALRIQKAELAQKLVEVKTAPIEPKAEALAVAAG